MAYVFCSLHLVDVWELLGPVQSSESILSQIDVRLRHLSWQDKLICQCTMAMWQSLFKNQWWGHLILWEKLGRDTNCVEDLCQIASESKIVIQGLLARPGGHQIGQMIIIPWLCQDSVHEGVREKRRLGPRFGYEVTRGMPAAWIAGDSAFFGVVAVEVVVLTHDLEVGPQQLSPLYRMIAPDPGRSPEPHKTQHLTCWPSQLRHFAEKPKPSSKALNVSTHILLISTTNYDVAIADCRVKHDKTAFSGSRCSCQSKTGM